MEGRRSYSGVGAEEDLGLQNAVVKSEVANIAFMFGCWKTGKQWPLYLDHSSTRKATRRCQGGTGTKVSLL